MDGWMDGQIKKVFYMPLPISEGEGGEYNLKYQFQ